MNIIFTIKQLLPDFKIHFHLWWTTVKSRNVRFGPKWVTDGTNLGIVQIQNVLISDLRKYRICPIWPIFVWTKPDILYLKWVSSHLIEKWKYSQVKRVYMHTLDVVVMWDIYRYLWRHWLAIYRFCDVIAWLYIAIATLMIGLVFTRYCCVP